MTPHNRWPARASLFLHARLSPALLPRFLAVVLLASAGPGKASEFETPPVLDAGEIAGDIPLFCKNYTISEAVRTDGFMATYTIASPFGEFSASGPGMLAARLDEIRALAALDQMQDDEQFKSAAADTARESASGLRTLAANPQETLKGVPGGVGRFFGRTGRSVRTGVQKLDDVRQDRLPELTRLRSRSSPADRGLPLTRRPPASPARSPGPAATWR